MIKRAVFLLFTGILLIACSNGDPEFDQIDQKIDYLIGENRYEDALDALDSENREDPLILNLYEKVHLNYGLHNMNTFDEREMRTRMNEALRQFTEVLRINPENDVARNQIDQILEIYDTIPERQPEEDVLEGLREIGYSV